jgi:hypothetical protein
LDTRQVDDEATNSRAEGGKVGQSIFSATRLTMHETINSRDAIRSRHPGLPRGLRQSDCDGPFDPLADAGGRELWLHCTDDQREQIATRFVASRGDDVRDCLVEAQNLGKFDCPTPDGQSPGDGIEHPGNVLWRVWAAYRDKSLNELRRQGRLNR